MKDALNRRSRFAPPQPFEHAPDISQDIELFQAIDRHGPLPTPLIAKLDKRKNYANLQRRLLRLYNGHCATHRRSPKHVCSVVTYLSRDPRQWRNIHARYQPAVYSLTLAARMLLLKHDRHARPFPRSNSFVHDLFLSCFTASFELQARRFRFRDDLLDHPQCPETTRAADHPFHFFAGGDAIQPDDILGNEYEEGKSRFFALEIDCANESNAKTQRKLKDYQEVLRSSSFRRLGLPNITILYPTVRNEKRDKILAYVRQYIEPEFQGRFLTKTFPEFAEPWRIGKEPLEVMADWWSVGGAADISKKAP